MPLAICHSQKTYNVFPGFFNHFMRIVRLKRFDTVLIIKYRHLLRTFHTFKRVYTKILLCCRKKRISLVFCKFLITLFHEYQSNFASTTFLMALLVRSIKIVISIIKIRRTFIISFSSASFSAMRFYLYYVYVCVLSITVFPVRM